MIIMIIYDFSGLKMPNYKESLLNLHNYILIEYLSDNLTGFAKPLF